MNRRNDSSAPVERVEGYPLLGKRKEALRASAPLGPFGFRLQGYINSVCCLFVCLLVCELVSLLVKLQ